MAGRATLSFIGPEEVFLSGEPEVTYFVEKYQARTPFASRVDVVPFYENHANFGTEKVLTLPRSGDLITNIYLRVELPAGAVVLDSAGTLLFSYIELYFGSELIERLWGEYIEMRSDLGVPAAMQPGLSTLVGKNLTFSGPANPSYTIQLPFSIMKKGIPLCAFREDVTLRFLWNPTSVFLAPTSPRISQFFSAHLNIEYTYISDYEINYLRRPHIQIIEQVQLANYFSYKNGGAARVFQTNLDFYNQVKELYFVLQNDTALGYDYSIGATGSSTSIGTGDILSNLELKFNNVERIYGNVGSPTFLRIIQPMEYHTRLPDRLFYLYSFCIEPESEIPSGVVNFSLINNQNIKFTLLPNPNNVNIRIYARSYNFLQFGNGSVSTMFSNFF